MPARRPSPAARRRTRETSESQDGDKEVNGLAAADGPTGDRRPRAADAAAPLAWHVPGALFIVLLPVAAWYGWFHVLGGRVDRRTLELGLVWYFFCWISYTAGYHRLWAHGAYQARAPLRLLFALLGAGNFTGSIRSWVRDHRAHHRHIDTPKDPLNIHRGFFYAYLGWFMTKTSDIGTADVSDLDADWVVRFQHAVYPALAVGVGWLVPAWIASQWGDPQGGLVFAGVIRTLAFTHVTHLTRALGHVVGHRPYSERTSARNNALLSLITGGENHLNWHYEFPSDYRLGYRFYHMDITKWAIRSLAAFRLAHSLKKTPLHDALMVRVQMQQERLNRLKQTLTFGPEEDALPLMTAAEFEQGIREGRKWVIMDGMVHDIARFILDHPGGAAILGARVGRDITRAFNGGVQRHSKAARNLAAHMRAARLESVGTSPLEAGAEE